VTAKGWGDELGNFNKNLTINLSREPPAVSEALITAENEDLINVRRLQLPEIRTKIVKLKIDEDEALRRYLNSNSGYKKTEAQHMQLRKER
jgi:hypothetical protein